ncbi:MAG TPA: hypothetical protein ENJ56_00290, partial [Anaerolineae bacterium]|nr:hypothetical protein [Anaerolineae bacterium]
MNNSQQLFVIGVDGGGSKTAAVILDRFGQVMGRGRSGSANYHHLGLAAVGENLGAAMQAAAQAAGVDWRQAAAVTWALSGVDRPIDRQRMVRLSAEILPTIPFIIENDALAALIAGLSHIQPNIPPSVTHNGIVQIAGTGTITYGENSQGKRARAGGWGYMSEVGSAYQLAMGALRAVNNALDKIIPPTLLTNLLLSHLELEIITDILTWMYADERQVADIAGLAPLVTEAAGQGDMAAIGILQHHADALAQHVLAVAKELGLPTEPFHLVYAGSLLTQAHFYRELVTQAVQTQLPLVRPKIATHDPAVGAGLLALEKLGLTENTPLILGDIANTPHTTEQRNILSNQLDTLSTLQFASLMHLQDRQAAASLQPVLPAIATAIDTIAARMQRGGRLIYVGAGTSGRLGVLDASECPPTFNADPTQVVGVIAGGMAALTRSIESAEDDPAAGAD